MTKEHLMTQEDRDRTIRLLVMIAVAAALVVAVLLVVFMNDAHGYAGTPLPKNGICPSGYADSGAYCYPVSERACHAIPKVGQCPPGYAQSGNYCLEMNCGNVRSRN